MKTGSCLCGAVKYQVSKLGDVTACHCEQCRKQTGNYWASSSAKDIDLKLVETRGLKWFRSSETAQRGFCGECGSTLFWKGDGKDYTAITAGTIDGKSGLKLAGHIYCDNAGDYYEIAGGDYKKGQWS
jgi:hypothetical protein